MVDARVRPNHPQHSIMGWVQQYKHADNSDVGGHTKHRAEVVVMQNKLEDGWIRLNTNGSSKRDIPAGSGWLFQNDEGKWIIGFSDNLGFAKVELHADSSVVVRTLQITKDGSIVGWCLIQGFIDCLLLEQEVKIFPFYCDANFCAYALANMHYSNIYLKEVSKRAFTS